MVDLFPYIVPNVNRVLNDGTGHWLGYVISHRFYDDTGVYFSYPMNGGPDTYRHCWGRFYARAPRYGEERVAIIFSGQQTIQTEDYFEDGGGFHGASLCPRFAEYGVGYHYNGRFVQYLNSLCQVTSQAGYDPVVTIYDEGYWLICGFSIHVIRMVVGPETFYWARDIGLVAYSGPSESRSWRNCGGNDGTLQSCLGSY